MTMGWYRRGKVALDGFRSFTSKILRGTSIQEPSTRIFQNGYLISGTKFSGFSSYSSIFQRLSLPIGVYKNIGNSVLNEAKRYHADRYLVHHLKRRGPRLWFQNKGVLIVLVIGSGLLGTVCFRYLETVPCTRRTHFILLSKSLEKRMGEIRFQQIKEKYKEKVLPAMHPESIRVTSISKHIILALQRMLSKDIEADEILDNKCVQRSGKKAQERGSPGATSHFDGLNWEVLVVKEPIFNAVCLPGGKIVVFTGLLEHFRSDVEIATIIGHEVAHVIARHQAEKVWKNQCFAVLQLVLRQYFRPDIVNRMSDLFLRFPFSRRMEIEADYIGLLLFASAGYDPRVAPLVYEKLGKITGESGLEDYLSTHPSGKQRAKLLAQPKVMEEALVLYRESRT
ncbi:Mitochondrial metalloendopeptidase OMA1 [Quillaja saponaria]|uniref:Mitochondrial metalloendopeptidase OMA1 n=1 Tax=Quillaja saponaria TaxID=32244 RepID=A0AAD7PWZ4_QUISA|nr:Mitochondrial metalloendopeptidase OMA1 [Quillaja saponaria]